MKRPRPGEAEKIPQEWTPPKLGSMNPKAGQVAGGDKVKVEFEEDFPHEIASVKFGEVYAPQI